MTVDHKGVIEPRTWRSARLAGLFGRSLRPLFEDWAPSGYQLRLVRAMFDGFGLVRNPLGARVWKDPTERLRGIWVVGPAAARENGVVLYLHGGGYVFGSTRSHFGLAKRLSAASGLAVFMAEYRRAPEHRYPAAADDAFAAYRALLDRGFSPGRIVVAGDSVGGHLTASLLNDIERHGLPMPAAAVMFSPALDTSGAGARERDRVARDPVISPAYGFRCLSAYVGDTSASDPRLDVLSADVRCWPPVLIQVGDTECLLDDAKRMADRLGAAEVPCDLQVWPGQVHVFQALARYLPEARAAIGHAGRFMRSQVTARA